MTFTKGGSLSREDVPRLAKEDEIYLRNSITNEDCEILAEVLQITTTLKALDFDGTSVIALQNSKFIEALAKNRTIKLLDLAYCNCSVEGAKGLAAVLKENSTIEKIVWLKDRIGDEGVAALSEALKVNSTLQTLNLCGNDIGDEGAKALAASLKTNKALKELNLDYNNISDDGAVAMGDALKENTTLKTLSLYWNKIGEKGGSAILNALQENRSSSIESINLILNEVSGGTRKKIDKVIERITNFNAEIRLKEQELQSTITPLQRELEEKDRLVATQDEEIASMNTILRKIGDMVNNKSGDANHGGHDTQREIDDLRSVIEHYKTEIDSLKEQLKNSRPIETVDLTNEVDPSTATEDDSNHEEPPSKRRRTKSNLANALEKSQQMVAVKEEAVQRAAAAEANAEAARWEKDAVEASLRGVQEDLEDANEVVTQQTLATDIWQGRFDEIFELARAAGVDGKTLSEIRHRPLSSGS